MLKLVINYAKYLSIFQLDHTFLLKKSHFQHKNRPNFTLINTKNVSKHFEDAFKNIHKFKNLIVTLLKKNLEM